MKKTSGLLILLMGIIFSSYSQEYDDRLVTDQLQVNSKQEYFASFIRGFRDGLSKAKTGEFSSTDAVASFYNVDITTFPSLDERLVEAANGTSSQLYSAGFISSLKNVIKKADQFTTFRDLRNEYVSMAVTGVLSEKEAQALALLDITTQEIEKSVLNQDGARISQTPGNNSIWDLNNMSDVGIPIKENEISPDQRLPRWLICGLGAVGSAIMGAISGAGTGASVGALFGAVGAASGAIIGGVMGFIGGAASGIARYCQ